MQQKHILVELMSALTTLSDDEKASIEESFQIKNFGKGTMLLKEGQIARDSYFVIKGCIREYELLDGEEHTTAFFIENQPAANFHSLSNGVPSTKNLVCAEDTTIAILNVEKEQLLYKKHPRFETFCRKGMEQMMGHKQEQLAKFSAMTPEDRYLNLLAEQPELLNRFPHYQIASYLGMKPETLSRIRKRIVQKNKASKIDAKVQTGLE